MNFSIAIASAFMLCHRCIVYIVVAITTIKSTQDVNMNLNAFIFAKNDSLYVEGMSAPPLPFYLETAVWPFIHTLVPAALYLSTRSWKFSLLVIYISESLEALFAPIFNVFAEQIGDALIGDILIGGLAITILFVLDRATGADIAFLVLVSPLRRFLAFLLIVALTIIAPQLTFEGFNFGVLFYFVLYTLVMLGFYASVLYDTVPGSAAHVAGQSIAVWLVMASIYALVALPVFSGFLASMFWRMLFLSLFFLIAAFIVYHVSFLNRLYGTGGTSFFAVLKQR